MPSILSWNSQTDLIPALARRTGLDLDRAAPDCQLPDWQLQLEEVALYGANLDEELRRAAPAVLDLGSAGLFGLLGGRGRKATLLLPDRSTRPVPWDDLIDTVLESQNRGAAADVDRLLASWDTQECRRGKARRAILRERLHNQRLGTLRLLSTDPGANFFRQLRHAGVMRSIAAFVTAHGIETLLWITVWLAAGQAALSGHLETGWMLGWTLLLIALVPARLWKTWSQGRLFVGAGGLLQQRLLAGALRLESQQVAQDGAGRFFSRIAEASALESLALSGGLTAAASLVEIVVAACILGRGADGGLLAGLFAAWLVVAAAAIWRAARARAHWTETRLSLTQDTVEQMTGHRTRLAQEDPESRHAGEDTSLDRYHAASIRMDRWNVCTTTLIPRGWLVLGIAGVLHAFVSGAKTTDLAIALWGVLLAQQGLQQITTGASGLMGAVISWKYVAPLFRAAATIKPEPTLATIPASARTVAHASDIVFRYPDSAHAVLDGVSLRIARGDWVLLEGESGKGKSTLLSILAGLREPAAGLLTSGGIDRRTLGSRAWRERIAAAPQYHENHILTGTLAFNLLLGRAWPPTRADLAEALEICRELGLEGLIQRMPGGLDQMVGETGWQLSQGERSRVFLARALLQRSQMVILDESFAALDPENLRQAMECVLRRAPTLLVAAHP
jgi:ATP-binding cassette subfamily B protein